ncbi:hypothetical protein Tco_0859649 [Tanacetum coccineum]|uniref:Uncharacterized protein n=1 Tax=Tanacetum coccineum TaxID=301880 RepID=A0ABQ5BFP3_9ASTR
MGRGTMSIDDVVIRHTYFPKPRAKTYLDNFELDDEDDWLSCFEVGRDEDGNPKYGPVQLKNTDWGNEGHGVYKKIEGDGDWHAKFEVITPSGRKFTIGFKTKDTKRKLFEKFTSKDILKFDHFLD